MARFIIKRGDLKPTMSAFLTDSDGAAVDLTSASGIKFIMKSPSLSTAKIDSSGTISNASTGAVLYQWQGTDTDTAGTYNAEFEVNWGSGDYQTFPTEGYIEVEVIADLGGDA